jgi:hypothetical protein
MKYIYKYDVLRVEMPRHQWTKDDIRKVFKTCKEHADTKDRVRILQSDFPDCSVGALKFQIIRYQKRNDDTLSWIPEQGVFDGYGANGRLHDEVWNEYNWRN